MSEPKNRHEAASQASLWLNDGLRMARGRDENVTPGSIVWHLVLDAVGTIEGLPDQERTWLTSGTRSGGWNAVGLTADDARTIENARLMAGIVPGDRMRASPQAIDVARAMGVTEWLRFTHTTRLGPALGRAAYLLAAGKKEAACYAFRPNHTAKTERQRENICKEIRFQACSMILVAIDREFGIGVDAGGPFFRNAPDGF